VEWGQSEGAVAFYEREKTKWRRVELVERSVATLARADHGKDTPPRHFSKPINWRSSNSEGWFVFVMITENISSTNGRVPTQLRRNRRISNWTKCP
jgi:hypothetical protein